MKKRHRKKRRETQAIEKVEAELVDTCETLPRGYAAEMMSLAVAETLRGTNGLKLQEVMKSHGYDMGRDKAYRLLAAAKQEVAKRASHNFDENFAFVEQNWLDIHAKAVKDGDVRTRGAALRELTELWGLKRNQDADVDTEITPEMIENFERALLR